MKTKILLVVIAIAALAGMVLTTVPGTGVHKRQKRTHVTPILRPATYRRVTILMPTTGTRTFISTLIE
jgi:hypothetical protein